MVLVFLITLGLHTSLFVVTGVGTGGDLISRGLVFSMASRLSATEPHLIRRMENSNFPAY